MSFFTSDNFLKTRFFAEFNGILRFKVVDINNVFISLI